MSLITDDSAHIHLFHNPRYKLWLEKKGRRKYSYE